MKGRNTYQEDYSEEMFLFKERMKGYIDNLPLETTLRYMGVCERAYHMYSEEEIFKLIIEKFSLGFFQLDRKEIEKPIY